MELNIEPEKLIYTLRFPSKFPACPECSTRVVNYENKTQFECLACRSKDRNKRVRFNVYTKTLLEQTKLSPYQIIALAYDFCSNKNPEDIKKDKNMGVSLRAVENFFKKIQEGILMKSQNQDLKKKTEVFSFVFKKGWVSIVSFPELSEKMVYNMQYTNNWNGDLYKKYPIFFTIRNQVGIQKNKLTTQELEFWNYYESYYLNGRPRQIYSRNFHAYLKTLEYLYNLQKRLIAEHPKLSSQELLQEMVKNILGLLLKVKMVQSDHKVLASA